MSRAAPMGPRVSQISRLGHTGVIPGSTSHKGGHDRFVIVEASVALVIWKVEHRV